MNQLTDIRDRLLHVAETVRSDAIPDWLFGAYIQETILHVETLSAAFDQANPDKRGFRESFEGYLVEVQDDCRGLMDKSDNRAPNLIMRNLRERLQQVIGLVNPAQAKPT